MSRLRIVVDTNVLVSAALKPLGRAALVIHLIAFRAVDLFVSRAILGEYREVFSRPKFAHLPIPEVVSLLTLIEREATLVEPGGRLVISEHDSDNRFYECARAAAADYIVTGNAKHFAHDLPPTRIVSVGAFLDRIVRAAG